MFTLITRKKRLPIIRALSLFLIQAFILSSVAFAIPKDTNPIEETLSEADIVRSPDRLVVPKDYGMVKSKHIGDGSKLVIHIQDAHCNFEAQSNIVKILDSFINNYKLRLISVEGAEGYIDTTWFKAFPDADVRREVATYFMKKGEITGPEFLSITEDYPVKLFGAENKSYYIKNLNAFTSSYRYMEQSKLYFNQIKTILNRLKGYIYSNALKEFDEKIRAHEAKEIQFNDYSRYLKAIAEKRGINIREYQNFNRLANTLHYEDKIDFDVVDKERNGLIGELTKKLNEQNAKDKIQQLATQALTFKVGKISQAEFYNYLRKLAAENGVVMAEKFPNLSNFVIYVSIYDKIENEELFGEIDAIIAAIKETMFKDNDQRTLDRLAHHVDTILGLVDIKLLNKDYEYYVTHREEFKPGRFLDFIQKKSQQYGLAYDIGMPEREILEEAIPKLEDFYAIALKRDQAIVDNTLEAMKNDEVQISVLVSGGFHTQGITQMLKDKGVSYLVVSPNITKDVETPYIQVLTNQRTPFEDILIGASETSGTMITAALLTWLRSMPPEERAEMSKAINVAIDRTLSDRAEDDIKAWERRFIALTIKEIRAKYHDNRRLQQDARMIAWVFTMMLDARRESLKKYFVDTGLISQKRLDEVVAQIRGDIGPRILSFAQAQIKQRSRTAAGEEMRRLAAADVQYARRASPAADVEETQRRSAEYWESIGAPSVQIVPAEESVRSEKGFSHIKLDDIPVAVIENGPGIRFFRGGTWFWHLTNRKGVDSRLITNRAEFEAAQNVPVYIMNHGIVIPHQDLLKLLADRHNIPQYKRLDEVFTDKLANLYWRQVPEYSHGHFRQIREREFEKFKALYPELVAQETERELFRLYDATRYARLHDTVFPQPTPVIPGTNQLPWTPGHLQDVLDIKEVKQPEAGEKPFLGIQYQVRWNEAGEAVDVIVTPLRPGVRFYALPGYADYIVEANEVKAANDYAVREGRPTDIVLRPVPETRFHNISVELPKETIRRMLDIIGIEPNTPLITAEQYSQIQGTHPHVFYQQGGLPFVAGEVPIRWIQPEVADVSLVEQFQTPAAVELFDVDRIINSVADRYKKGNENTDNVPETLRTLTPKPVPEVRESPTAAEAPVAEYDPVVSPRVNRMAERVSAEDVVSPGLDISRESPTADDVGPLGIRAFRDGLIDRMPPIVARRLAQYGVEPGTVVGGTEDGEAISLEELYLQVLEQADRLLFYINLPTLRGRKVIIVFDKDLAGKLVDRTDVLSGDETLADEINRRMLTEPLFRAIARRLQENPDIVWVEARGSRNIGQAALDAVTDQIGNGVGVQGVVVLLRDETQKDIRTKMFKAAMGHDGAALEGDLFKVFQDRNTEKVGSARVLNIDMQHLKDPMSSFGPWIQIVTLSIMLAQNASPEELMKVWSDIEQRNVSLEEVKNLLKTVLINLRPARKIEMNRAPEAYKLALQALQAL
ncbi:MAG: hypothetical protein ABIJ27_07770 [Candidatus Omnitrophota bacterium]